MKKVVISLLATVPALSLAFLTTLTPRSVQAVPSYARQTGLPCSGATTIRRSSILRDESSSYSVTLIKTKTSQASRTIQVSDMRGLTFLPRCPSP